MGADPRLRSLQEILFINSSPTNTFCNLQSDSLPNSGTYHALYCGIVGVHLNPDLECGLNPKPYSAFECGAPPAETTFAVRTAAGLSSGLRLILVPAVFAYLLM